MLPHYRTVGVRFFVQSAAERDAVRQLGVFLRILADRSQSYRMREMARDVLDSLLAEVLDFDAGDDGDHIAGNNT